MNFTVHKYTRVAVTVQSTPLAITVLVSNFGTNHPTYNVHTPCTSGWLVSGAHEVGSRVMLWAGADTPPAASQ